MDSNEEISDNPKNLKLINIDCSPSHLPNNLSISDNSLIFIHNSENQSRGIFVEKQ